MNRSPAWVAWSLLCLLWASVLAGCDGSASSPSDGSDDAGVGERVWVASIHPLADLAQSVAGGAVRVELLLPPGASPHGFSPTPRALARLAEAEWLLVAGRGLDPWATRTAERLGVRPRVIRLADFADDRGAEDPGVRGAAPRGGHDHAGGDGHAGHAPEEHVGPNPHLWLDPVVVRRFVGAVADALIEGSDEAEARAIRRRRDALLATIESIDSMYRTRLAGVPHRELITFHNAFDPLAERYGLRVVAHLTPIELGAAGEVSAARLDRAARAIESHGVPAVYVEPQFARGVADRLAEQTGVAVWTLDPLGHPEVAGRRTWAELMRYNLETLVRGQGGDAEGPSPERRR